MSNTHEANVVRVGPILPHPNADKLELTMVGGYQVVLGKGQFKQGDLAIYIQPDSVVPQTEPFQFIWKDHVGIDGIVPAKRRRITVKRLRKEYSEGLLMPVKDFGFKYSNEGWETPNATDREYPDSMNDYIFEGQDVAARFGIEHYVPEGDLEDTHADSAARPKRKYPRTWRGWFFWTLRQLGWRKAGGRSYALEVGFDFPVYDVDALKNSRRKFEEGERVLVTEKIHGSNARYVFVPDGSGNDLNPGGKFYAGSREQWKMDGPNIWWNAVRQHPEIEEWCHQNPGLVLYGEVGPTQKGFRYGCEEGETFFFAFDVYNPDTREWSWPGNLGFASTAPALFSGPYDSEGIKAALIDGPSVVPSAKNIREGVVISSIDRRLKLKVVSNAYFEQENKR